MATQQYNEVRCLECGTLLGGQHGKEPYKHIVVCLHGELQPVERMKLSAEAEKSEHGNRILHILNGIEFPAPPPAAGEAEAEGGGA